MQFGREANGLTSPLSVRRGAHLREWINQALQKVSKYASLRNGHIDTCGYSFKGRTQYGMLFSTYRLLKVPMHLSKITFICVKEVSPQTSPEDSSKWSKQKGSTAE